MIRTVAGVFQPGGLSDPEAQRRRVAAGATTDATVYESGSLVLAATGPPPVIGRHGLVLVDGDISLTADGAQDQPWTADDQRRMVDSDEPIHLDRLLSRVRGAFVAVVQNEHPDELVLIRDQFGGRPLVFFREGQRLVFASEVRDLLSMLRHVPGPDDATVISWLQTGLVPPGQSFYHGVRPLRPAHVLRVTELATNERRYWDPQYRPPRHLATGEIDEALSLGIERAIRRRIPREGPIGIMLGGGIDASTVAAFVRRIEGPDRELVGYSAVFPHHATVDESELISATTTALGMRSCRLEVPRASLLEGAVDFVDRWRVPLGPPTHAFMRSLVARSAHDGMAVLLDGEGGDETFGASPYMIGNHLRRGRIDLAWKVARRPSGTGLYLNPLQMVRFAWSYGARPTGPKRRLAAESASGWLRPDLASQLATEVSETAWADQSGPYWWRWLSWTLVRSRELVGAHGFFRRQADGLLPRRHPFLDDVDLLELVLSLPPETAHHPEITRPALRRLTTGLLPDEVRLRRAKAVWNEVLDRAIEGADRATVARLLLDPDAQIRRYVDVPTIRRFLANDRGQSSVERRLHYHEVWRIAVIEIWLRSLADADVHHPVAAVLGTGDHPALAPTS